MQNFYFARTLCVCQEVVQFLNNLGRHILDHRIEVSLILQNSGHGEVWLHAADLEQHISKGGLRHGLSNERRSVNRSPSLLEVDLLSAYGINDSLQLS